MVEWKRTGNNWSAQRTLLHCQFVCHKSHMERNEIKPGRSGWKVDYWLPMDFGEAWFFAASVYVCVCVCVYTVQQTGHTVPATTDLLTEQLAATLDRRSYVLEALHCTIIPPVECRIYCTGKVSVLRYICPGHTVHPCGVQSVMCLYSGTYVLDIRYTPVGYSQ
jgi:hypothetical protein